MGSDEQVAGLCATRHPKLPKHAVESGLILRLRPVEIAYSKSVAKFFKGAARTWIRVVPRVAVARKELFPENGV